MRADKLREVTRRPRRHLGRASRAGAGREGDLRRAHDRRRTSSNAPRDDVQVTRGGPAQPCPSGTRTEAGLRHNIRVGVQYLEAWLRGNGCVPLYNLMEDAATAEISRAQVWQWLHHGAALDDGRHGRPASCSTKCLGEEMERIRSEVGDGPVRRRERSTRRASCSSSSRRHRAFEEFLTLPAYEHLLARFRLTAARTVEADSFERREEPYHDPDRLPIAANQVEELEHRSDLTRSASTGIVRPYTAGRRRALRGSVQDRAHARRAGREAALGAAPHRGATSTRSARSPATRRCRWCAPGLKAIYLSRLAGGGRREHRRPDVPRPEPLPGRLRAERGAADQQRAPPRRPDRARRGQARARTGSRRSSPTPRPASAARSTPSS